MTQVTDAAEIRGYGRIVDLPPRVRGRDCFSPDLGPRTCSWLSQDLNRLFYSGKVPRWAARVLAEGLLAGTGRVRSASLGEGTRAVQRGAFPEETGGGASVTCAECRAEMCTTELLSKLRCAECHQIRRNELYDFAHGAFLVGLGGVTAWLLIRLWSVTTSREAHERQAA